MGAKITGKKIKFLFKTEKEFVVKTAAAGNLLVWYLNTIH